MQETRRKNALSQWQDPQRRPARNTGGGGGREWTPEQRERLRQASLGRRHSNDTKEKLRRIALEGAYRPPSRKGQVSYRGGGGGGGHKWSPQQQEKFRESMKPIWASPEFRAKHRISRLHQKFPSKMTSIEQALIAEFRKRRLKFEMHKTMFGRFQPDFVFQAVKLIVQADGDYWHRQCKPSRDTRFNEAAALAGWTVWRFAESEVQQHPQACGRAVARFVRSH